MQHLITTVRHPRADHPGSPWTGFLNKVLPPSGKDVWAVPRQRSFDVRTLPQPNIDWIKNVAEPPAAPFDPIYFPPSDFESKQYRSPTSYYTYIESQPNEGWFAGAQTLWEVWHGVPSRDQSQSYLAPGRPLTAVQTQPNDGWFKSSQSLWEIWDGVGPRDQSLSFLPPGRLRTWIETNRDIPWLRTPLNLWEVPFYVPAHSEMQSFRPRSSLQAGPPEGQIEENAYLRQTIPPPVNTFPAIKQLLDSFEIRARYSVLESRPQDAWILTKWEVWDGVGPRDQTHSYRAPGRLLTSIETNRDLPWLSTPLNLWGVPYHVPAHSEMQSFRPKSSLQPPPDGNEQEYAYLRQTIPPAIEIFASVQQDSHLPRSSLQRVLPSDPDNAWIFKSVPVVTPFDEALIAATYELLRGFIPASSIEWIGPELGDFAWIKENLSVVPPFDQALMAATYELLRGFVPNGSIKWFDASQPDFSWVFPLTEVLAASVIDFLPRSAKPFNPHIHNTLSDLGWLFENVPPVVPFDPVNFRNALETFLAPRTKFDLRLVQQPQQLPQTFIMVDMMAPYLHGELPEPKARGFDKRYITEPDYAWIFRNLPALVNQLTFFSHGELPILKARGLDGRYLTHTDISWIFENLPGVAAPTLRPMRTKNWHRNR